MKYCAECSGTFDDGLSFCPRDGGAWVDGRADVYSLGVIAFELVAGRKPHDGRTLSELRRRHVSEPPPLQHEAAGDVPAAFGQAVARAMSKDRADRQPTAGAFVGDLRAALGLASETGDARFHPVLPTARRTDAGRGPEALTVPLPPRPDARDAEVLDRRIRARADARRGRRAGKVARAPREGAGRRRAEAGRPVERRLGLDTGVGV